MRGKDVWYPAIYARILRRERRFRDRLDPFDLSDQELIRYYRFPQAKLLQMIEELTPGLRRRTGSVHAIPPHTQLLITLHTSKTP